MELNVIVNQLKSLLTSEDSNKEIEQFLQETQHPSKWMLYSDYCLDDKNKPNNVITFVMVPFVSIDKYLELESKIKETQPKDIKESKDISLEFSSLIKNTRCYSFTFIIEKRKELFGKTGKERQKSVKEILEHLRDQFTTWLNNETQNKLVEYYKDTIKKLRNQIIKVDQNKSLKDLMDIFLITIIGALVSSAFLKNLPKIDIFGWFPDRDKTNESCDKIAVPLFNAYQYNLLNGVQYQFVSSVPDSKVKPFYDEYNRIADIICGTIADYNFKDNLISKDKFNSVLQNLIADNSYIKIYRIFSDEDKYKLSEIKISNSPIENI